MKNPSLIAILDRCCVAFPVKTYCIWGVSAEDQCGCWLQANHVLHYQKVVPADKLSCSSQLLRHGKELFVLEQVQSILKRHEPPVRSWWEPNGLQIKQLTRCQ